MSQPKEAPRARGVIKYVLIDETTGEVVDEGERTNLITTSGTQDIAQAMARAYGSGTPIVDDVMDYIALGRSSQASAPAAGNTLSSLGITDGAAFAQVDSGYPKLAATTGDDASNSGSGGPNILTWRATYAAGTYDYADIDDVAITENGAALPAGSTTIMNHATGLAIDKSGGTKSLRIWVNIAITPA